MLVDEIAEAGRAGSSQGASVVSKPGPARAGAGSPPSDPISCSIDEFARREVNT